MPTWGDRDNSDPDNLQKYHTRNTAPYERQVGKAVHHLSEFSTQYRIFGYAITYHRFVDWSYDAPQVFAIKQNLVFKLKNY